MEWESLWLLNDLEMLDELFELLLLELLEKLDDKLLALEIEVLLLDESPLLEEELELDDFVLDELLDLVDELDEDLVLEPELSLELFEEDELDRLELGELEDDDAELTSLWLLRLLEREVLVWDPVLLEEVPVSRVDDELELRLDSALPEELELLLELRDEDDLVLELDPDELLDFEELLDLELLRLERLVLELLEWLLEKASELRLDRLDRLVLLTLELGDDQDVSECRSLELDSLNDSEEPELALVALTYSELLSDEDLVLLELSLLLEDSGLKLLEDENSTELIDVLLEELELEFVLDELELLLESDWEELLEELPLLDEELEPLEMLVLL